MSRCSAEIVFFAGRSVFRVRKFHRKSASHHILNITKFFVMDERFFCDFFSKTKSEKRPTDFEPVPSHGLNLERFFCEQETRKRQGGHDESLFGQDLVFCRPVGLSSRKSSRKECFALGSVDGAPSTASAKHSL